MNKCLLKLYLFYFSFFSVITNTIISVYFFEKIGFIIIPIATTISSWLNALLLLIYLITFYSWIDDNTFSLEKTMNALDKNLDQVEKFSKYI